MKILKIFSVVVGLHVFALLLIFANPGCSSPNKPASSPSETASQNEEGSNVVSRAAPEQGSPVVIARGDSPVSSAPSSFDPDAAAVPGIRFSPTRPGTPVAASLETHPVGDVRAATTYTIVKGDSLWLIAKKHKISIAELAAANNIKQTASVRLGQKLIIPSASPHGHSIVDEYAASRSAEPAAAPVTRARGESVKHVVRSGETLGAIARKYQVKVGEIATANNISDPAKIRPGMELVIPGWQAPAVRSANTASPAPATNTTEQPVAPAVSGTEPSPVLPAPEEPTDNPPIIRVE